MANDYFDFKQFRVAQGNCGMKVSTDACIQGAWTPLPPANSRILDVGTGTGLLALMLAQRAPHARIDALEIDEAAVLQARENIGASRFGGRINVHHTDVRIWLPETSYDVLICNPPFFRNSLLGPQDARNQARHNLTLQFEDLVLLFERSLAPEGYASVLLPVEESHAFAALAAQNGWFLSAQLGIRDRETAPVKRTVSIYSRNARETAQTVLTIKENDGTYTTTFKELLSPFYLDR